MGSATTYRLWMHVEDVVKTRKALERIIEFPHGPARPADFDWWNGMPAMFDAQTSFSNMIPPTQPDGLWFWVIEGDVLVLCIDLINPYVRHDHNPDAEHGEPSRSSVLMNYLSGLSSEPDGKIVGGMQTEHSDDWIPLVSWKGRIMPTYVPGAQNYDRKPQRIIQHDGLIPIDTIRENVDGRSLSVSSPQ